MEMKQYKKALSNHYDIIFMDCQMPNKDGFTAAKEIKMQKPDIKIVAITALAFPEDRQRCYDAGMVDYLSKPFTRDDIATVLRRYAKNT